MPRAILACVVAAVLVQVPTQQSTAATRTVALGLDVLNKRGQTPQAALTAAESQLGRKVAFTRDFRLWDSYFPSSYETWLGARGTVPMISVRPVRGNGQKITWGAIAAASSSSSVYGQIRLWAQRIKAYGHKVYFTLSHEPETSVNTAFGTSAQFVAAWRKVVTIFRSVGVSNVKFLWIMSSWAFQVRSTDRRAASKWYPGDSYVDAMAADAYNWWNCNPANDWNSMATVLSGFVAFGRQHPTKSLWLAEFASNEDRSQANRKAQWITDTRNLLKSSAYSQVAGISYYNAPDSQGRNCAWPFTSSTAAKTAMVGLARDSFYSGHA